MKKAFSVACLLAFLACQVQAANFTVTNTADAGAGSFRQAIADSNTAGGANSISWAAGSGGMINIVSDLPAINDGTTLDVTAAPAAVTIAGVNAMALSGSTTFFNNAVPQTWTVSTPIKGAGSLNKGGAGTLYLLGSNSYSGGTALNGGVLSINNDAALGPGNLAFNGGTLQFQTPTLFSLTDSRAIMLGAGGGSFDTAGSTLTTLAGVIGGVGALTKISSGTLALTNANTYTGGTVVLGGVLNVISDTNLGDPAGALTLNGGTLQTSASMLSARGVTLGAGGGTIDTNGYNLTLSGVIGGAGALSKIGGGALQLNAVNTYGGGTTIGAGVVRLGVSNALPTNGALTVQSGATFDLNGFNQTNSLGAVANAGLISAGAGQLTLNSGYSGAGTLALTVRQGITNITSAGNNINLNGGTLAVTLANQAAVRAGSIFTPVSGTTGAGPLPTVTGPAALTLTPSYAGNNLVLTVGLVPLASIAASPNQSAIGSALEPLRANPSGDMSAVLGSLYTLNAPQLRAALDQIGPVALSSMGGIGMAGSSVQSAAVSQRMTVLARGSDRDRVGSYVVSGRSFSPGTLVASAADMGALEQGETKDWSPDSPWGFFASGVGTAGRLADANSGSSAQPGYAFNSGGLTVGGDYRVSDHIAAGLSGGYLHGHASVYAPASGTVDNSSVRYGAYATSYGENCRANLYIGGARDIFSTQRGIAFGSIARTATARPDGAEFNTALSASYDFPKTRWGIFSPFAGLNYDRLMIDPFTEDGAGSLNLSVSGQTAESLKSSLGVRWSDKFQGDSYVWSPYMSLGWRHEFEDQSRPIEAQLASGAGSVFSVATGSFARNGTLVGTGFTVTWGQTTAKLDYAGDFRSHFNDNSFNGSVRFRF